MSEPATTLSSTNGASSAQELFALSDEQILDIEPHSSGAAPVAQAILPVRDVAPTAPQTAQAGLPAPLEPPPWLAQQMKDPWSGDEARELWNGVVQARNDAAAYREVFAKPEEARAAADRAHALEEIDSAFFGGAGKSAQEISAGRAALAQRMLREDPAAFREMVFAGLRALGESSQSPNIVTPFKAAPPANAAVTPEGGPKPGPSNDGQLDAYRSFEKSANEELERSVGGAIQHSLELALPNLLGADRSTGVASRLQQSVRDGVEAALKSDQQLGEQLARVLSARRFDEATRSQVVRLISDRAQQLVPVAARRVIQEWTQTAFAAHGKGTPGDARSSPANDANAASPRSLANSSPTSRGASTRASAPPPSAKAAAADRAERDGGFTPRITARPNGRAVDYTRLTDEQILDS